jgi:hypothetical protein
MKFERLAPNDLDALEVVRRQDLRLLWDVRLPLDEGDELVVYSLYELKDVQP